MIFLTWDVKDELEFAKQMGALKVKTSTHELYVCELGVGERDTI
jgi:hypothetical protein